MQQMNCLLSAWQAHEKSLYHWLVQHTKNPHDAEDILHDVFVKLMKRPQSLCTLKTPRAWLFKITKNQLIDMQRAKKQNAEFDFINPTETKPIISQLQVCLPRTLPKLQAHSRDIIECCDLEGMKQSDYAKQHDLSLPATKARLRRARLELMQLIASQCGVVKGQGSGVCCFKGLKESHEA